MMVEAFSGLGSVSKHKMLPNLIVKENADCLMGHSSQMVWPEGTEAVPAIQRGQD